MALDHPQVPDVEDTGVLGYRAADWIRETYAVNRHLAADDAAVDGSLDGVRVLTQTLD